MGLIERSEIRPREARHYSHPFSPKAFVLGIAAAVWIWTVDAFFDSIVRTDKPIMAVRSRPSSKVIKIGIATAQTLTEYTPGNFDFKQCPDLPDGRTCSYVPAHTDECEDCDALLFRGFHMEANTSLPSRHPTYQKWIFLETESPQRTWPHLQHMKPLWKQFNVTVTYAQDSNVRYSRFNSMQCKRKIDAPPMEMGNHASDKQNNATALWLVSNCADTSGRELYVEELRKHLPVDVYGDCGQPLPCEQFRRELNTKGGCVRRLMAMYKFYLSFENSFCDGYLTEKIWKTFRVNVIPVVMGQANYREMLTPGTYIDVKDFASPKDLADYLHYLAANDAAYNAIIEKRRSVECLKTRPGAPHCVLCQHLHQYKHQRQMAPDLGDFWSPARRCSPPGEFFRGIAEEVLKTHPHLRTRYV